MGGSVFFGSMAAVGGMASWLFMLLSILAFYIGTCYGLQLLAKKYEPKLHPVLSWIPLVNLYPIMKISGQSAWWILGLCIPLFNIYVAFNTYYLIAKRTGRGAGTMFLLVFFGFITLPWLGLTVHGKKTTLAWVLGIIAIVCYILGFFGIMATAVSAWLSTGMNPYVQEEVMEQMRNNPEIRAAMEQEMQNNPEARAAIEAMMEIKN